MNQYLVTARNYPPFVLPKPKRDRSRPIRKPNKTAGKVAAGKKIIPPKKTTYKPKE